MTRKAFPAESGASGDCPGVSRGGSPVFAPATVVAAVAARISRFGFAEVALSGRCMEPLLIAGDRVRIVTCPDLGVGDLCLVALPGGRLALHRVVAAVGGAVVCKGDFSGRAEEVPCGSVLGRAVAFAPDGSWGWVQWRQDDAYRCEIVSLSRVLSDREATHAMRQEARRRVWELNEGKRAELLACMYPPVG